MMGILMARIVIDMNKDKIDDDWSIDDDVDDIDEYDDDEDDEDD